MSVSPVWTRLLCLHPAPGLPRGCPASQGGDRFLGPEVGVPGVPLRHSSLQNACQEVLTEGSELPSGSLPSPPISLLVNAIPQTVPRVSLVNLIISPFPQTPQTKQQSPDPPVASLCSRNSMTPTWVCTVLAASPASVGSLSSQPVPSLLPGSPASCIAGRLHVLFPPLSCCSLRLSPCSSPLAPLPSGVRPHQSHSQACSFCVALVVTVVVWHRRGVGPVAVSPRVSESTGRRPGRPFAPAAAACSRRSLKE